MTACGGLLGWAFKSDFLPWTSKPAEVFHLASLAYLLFKAIIFSLTRGKDCER